MRRTIPRPSSLSRWISSVKRVLRSTMVPIEERCNLMIGPPDLVQ